MPESVVAFWTRYSHLCLKAKTCPLRTVIKYLKGAELCCPVETFRSEHWKLLLAALSVDNSLTKVHFGSFSLPTQDEAEQLKGRKRKSDKYLRIPYGRTEQNVSEICWSVGQLLKTSESIVVLKLENLTLKNDDVKHLAQGLKNSVVKHLSLAGCVISDNAVDIICQNLQYSDISWVDFSSCNLSRKSLISVCNVIKAHKIRRSSNEMFKETLRYRIAVLDAMKGLSRVSLNDNNLKDEMNILVESLEDDSWIKALDLQKCAVDNKGAKSLLNLAKHNGQLEIIDLRLNDIDDGILHRISQQLSLNKTGKTVKYEILPLWTSPRMKKKMPKFIASRKGMLLKKSSPPKLKISKKVFKSHASSTKVPYLSQNKSVSTVNVSSQTLSDSESSKVPNNVLEIMRKLKTSLTKEIELRRYFMQRLEISTAENIHLREELAKYTNRDDLVLIDIETFLEVKRTFEKFKRFLNIMKDYGLWEFVKMLGVNEDADIVLRLNTDSEKHMKIVETKPECHTESNNHSTSSRILKLQPDAKMNACCCSCRKVGCKLSENSQFKTDAGAQVRTSRNGKSDVLSVDKASVQRVFKEVRSNCIKENMANHQSENKKSSFNKQSTTVNANPSGKIASKGHVFIKKIPISSVPSKLRELNSPTEFYEIVRTELEECDRKFYSENVSAAAYQNNSTCSNTNKSSIGMNNRSVQTKLTSSPESANIPVAAGLELLRETAEKIARERKLAGEKQFKADFRLNSMNNTDVSDKLSACAHAVHRCAKNDVDTSSSERSCRNKSLLKSKSKFKCRSKKTFHSDSRSDVVLSDHSYSLPSYTSFHPESNVSLKPSQESVTLKSTGLINSKGVHVKPAEENIVSESSVASYEKSSSVKSSSKVSVTSSDKSDRAAVHAKGNENLSRKKSSYENDSYENEIRSYLESVSEMQKNFLKYISDASTDKDVKSFSEEVVSNVPSSGSKGSGSKHSENESVKEHSIEQSKPKSLSSHLEKKSVECLSDHKSMNEYLQKNLENSSVPSLSDITTVSSGSLNTDVVMNQLSESEQERD